jgi:hypothetical protein
VTLDSNSIKPPSTFPRSRSSNYGVAVQTGVVMVLYLHEADITDGDIREATIAGSVLRLRPKLMTVSVVMAGLLWSTGDSFRCDGRAGPVRSCYSKSSDFAAYLACLPA